MAFVNYAVALNELADQISDTANEKGFWNPEEVGNTGIIPLKLVLIASEVSEALAVHRNPYDDEGEDVVTGMTPLQEEDFAEELADIIIRTLDLGGYYSLDLGNVVMDKMAKNRDRPHLHGKKY